MDLTLRQWHQLPNPGPRPRAVGSLGPGPGAVPWTASNAGSGERAGVTAGGAGDAWTRTVAYRDSQMCAQYCTECC